MGLTRSSAAHATVCPVCDATLDPALAQGSEPACPHCETPVLPLRVAGFSRRLLAGVIDGVLLLLTAGLLNWALLAWLDRPSPVADARGLDVLLRLMETDVSTLLRPYMPTLGMAALYFGLFWSLTGRTPGHRVLRLRVVDAHGRPPGPIRGLLRVLGHAVGLAVGALGWLWMAFDRDKRGWHDHLANTYVVRDT